MFHPTPTLLMTLETFIQKTKQSSIGLQNITLCFCSITFHKVRQKIHPEKKNNT